MQRNALMQHSMSVKDVNGQLHFLTSLSLFAERNLKLNAKVCT